jgi:hypothetical protein
MAVRRRGCRRTFTIERRPAGTCTFVRSATTTHPPPSSSIQGLTSRRCRSKVPTFIEPRRPPSLSSWGATSRCRRLLRGSDITVLRCLDRNATGTGLLFDCAGCWVQAYGGLDDNPLQLIWWSTLGLPSCPSPLITLAHVQFVCKCN